MENTTKYPQINVKLSGRDGNAFMIMGAVGKTLKKGGIDQAEVDIFYKEATSGDYNHLLQTCMKWVSVS